jgi:hypothetical protein
MTNTIEPPKPFPVRCDAGKWETYIPDSRQWFGYDTEADARSVAQAPILWHESDCGLRSGEDFAKDLEHVADLLRIRDMGFAEGSFRHAAAVARGK